MLVRKCECARAPNSRSEHRQSTKCECARAQTKFNAVKIEAPSHFAHSHNRTLCGDTKCKFANVRKCSSTFALSHKHFALLVLCGDTLNRLAAQERKSDKGERLDSTLTCIHVALIWREGTTSTTYNTVLFSYHQSIRNRRVRIIATYAIPKYCNTYQYGSVGCWSSCRSPSMVMACVDGGLPQQHRNRRSSTLFYHQQWSLAIQHRRVVREGCAGSEVQGGGPSTAASAHGCLLRKQTIPR